MRHVRLRVLILAALAASTNAARADFVGDLGTLTPSATVAFANSTVTAGTTVTSNGVTYNFLDQWAFVLGSNADIASIAATIYFTAGAGNQPLFGIENLQLNLLTNPSSGPPLVSWLTVTTPAPGLNELVALIPSSPLGAGNYFLDVRGTLTAPGSYSGSLIADTPTEVPLPAALPLLLIGLGALGRVGFRSNRKPALGTA